MTLPRTAAEVLSGHVRFEIRSVDRMLLLLRQPRLQYRGRARRHRADPVRRPGQERTMVWRTRRRRDAATGRSYPWLFKESAMVNHWYVYGFDRDLGPFFIKFCGYSPFSAQIYLNGHEYAMQQCRRAGIGFTAADNAFTAVDDPDAVQQICDLSVRELACPYVFFGLVLIIWFVWLGIAMLRRIPVPTGVEASPSAPADSPWGETHNSVRAGRSRTRASQAESSRRHPCPPQTGMLVGTTTARPLKSWLAALVGTNVWGAAQPRSAGRQLIALAVLRRVSRPMVESVISPRLLVEVEGDAKLRGQIFVPPRQLRTGKGVIRPYPSHRSRWKRGGDKREACHQFDACRAPGT